MAANSVSLSNSDLEFLIGNIPDEGLRLILRQAREAHLAAGQPDRPVSVVFERHEVSTLLNELSSLLCEIGLGLDDEPNRTGLAIEELIDKVNRVKWPSK